MTSKLRLISMMAGLTLICLMLPTTVTGQGPQALTVEMSQDTATLTVGESVEFNTVLRNAGTEATPALVAHLNIASLQSGTYVDPEDWSGSRTRYLPALQPGETRTVHWQVRALSEGDFASFVTVVAADPGWEPVTGSTLKITGVPREVLPLRNVLPVVVAVPIVPLALFFVGIGQDIRGRRIAVHPRQ
jgi:hypothetical protein